MFVASGLLYTALTRNVSQTRSRLISLTDGRGKDKLQVLHLHMPVLTDAVPTRYLVQSSLLGEMMLRQAAPNSCRKIHA